MTTAVAPARFPRRSLPAASSSAQLRSPSGLWRSMPERGLPRGWAWAVPLAALASPTSSWTSGRAVAALLRRAAHGLRDLRDNRARRARRCGKGPAPAGSPRFPSAPRCSSSSTSNLAEWAGEPALPEDGRGSRALFRRGDAVLLGNTLLADLLGTRRSSRSTPSRAGGRAPRTAAAAAAALRARAARTLCGPSTSLRSPRHDRRDRDPDARRGEELGSAITVITREEIERRERSRVGGPALGAGC